MKGARKMFLFFVIAFAFGALAFAEKVNVLDYFPTDIGKTWKYVNDNGQEIFSVTVSDAAKDASDGSKQYLFRNLILGLYKTYTIYKCNKDEISIWLTVSALGEQKVNDNPYPISLTQPDKEWTEKTSDNEELHKKTMKQSCSFDNHKYDDCILVQEITLLNGNVSMLKKSYYAKNIGLVYVTLTDDKGKETVFQKLVN